MSYEFGITTTPSRLPSSAAWNAALRDAGFDIELDSVDWATHSGFLPARIGGLRSGFELWIDAKQPRKALFGLFRSPRSQSVRAFARLGSATAELTVASAAIASLQALTGGIYGDDDGRTLTAAESMAEALTTYRQWRFLAIRLEAASALPETQPPLEAAEDIESRRQIIKSLENQRAIVKEISGTGLIYRLHKQTAEDLEAYFKALNG